jgi:small-conductance mechanosensitive channel
MIFVECLFALAVALFLTVVFAVIGRQAKTPVRVLVFFLVVFLGAWAGGIWITPVGPSLLGVYWLSFFAAGLIFALILEAVAAFSARPAESQARDIQKDKKEEREIESVLGAFFWALLLMFVAAIVLGYLGRTR